MQGGGGNEKTLSTGGIAVNSLSAEVLPSIPLGSACSLSPHRIFCGCGEVKVNIKDSQEERKEGTSRYQHLLCARLDHVLSAQGRVTQFTHKGTKAQRV